MKLVKSSFEILEQEPGLDGIYKAIERAGRVCYKSENKITEDSAKGFVDMLIKRGHTAVLEQGTVYLRLPETTEETSIEHRDFMIKYMINPYSKMYNEGIFPRTPCVTTNYRVLYENDWLDDLKYLCEPTEHHSKRAAVKFICDRGVSHELVRHRVFSFAQESTRYCNYSKDKFGNELTFITPSWVKESLSPKEAAMYIAFRGACKLDESHYMMMIKAGATPQQARQVLPNALKTEVVMTGFIEDWDLFFGQRARGKFTDSRGKEHISIPHPDMLALTKPLLQEFIKRGYING